MYKNNQSDSANVHLTFANLIYGMTDVDNFLYFKAIGKICSLTIKVIPMSLVIYNIFLTAASLGRYCTCTYFSGIHILVKLALNQVR